MSDRAARQGRVAKTREGEREAYCTCLRCEGHKQARGLHGTVSARLSTFRASPGFGRVRAREHSPSAGPSYAVWQRDLHADYLAPLTRHSLLRTTDNSSNKSNSKNCPGRRNKLSRTSGRQNCLHAHATARHTELEARISNAPAQREREGET